MKLRGPHSRSERYEDVINLSPLKSNTGRPACSRAISTPEAFITGYSIIWWFIG
jgi:hypothetical protein